MERKKIVPRTSEMEAELVTYQNNCDASSSNNPLMLQIQFVGYNEILVGYNENQAVNFVKLFGDRMSKIFLNSARQSEIISIYEIRCIVKTVFNLFKIQQMR